MSKDKLYDGVTREAWVKELTEHSTWNVRHLFGVFTLLGTPATLLDIGCGLGENVKMATLMQIEAYGIDQLVDESDKSWEAYFFHCDLRNPFSLAERIPNRSVVDMVLCLEVAEHIPDDGLTIFCDTISNHLRRSENTYLIFTAAHPGQSGKEHINARPAVFWRDEFYSRGLNYDPETTSRLALHWLNIRSPKYWLAANLQVFTK
jgi:SAM-dependent methyltransferase